MSAIITGASKGLGNYLAGFLAEKGHDLHLIARSESLLSELKLSLEAKHKVEVFIYPCDFNDENQLIQLSKRLAELNPIDLLINNVGAFEFGGLQDSSLDQLNKMLNINLKAAFLISKAVIPLYHKAQKGHIFNIGIIVTEVPRADVAAYTISKFALNGFTKVLREELRPHKVKVTEFIPGSINTSSWEGVEDVPKNDFVQPKDIAFALWNCYQNTGASNIEEMVIRPLNKSF